MAATPPERIRDGDGVVGEGCGEVQVVGDVDVVGGGESCLSCKAMIVRETRCSKQMRIDSRANATRCSWERGWPASFMAVTSFVTREATPAKLNSRVRVSAKGRAIDQPHFVTCFWTSSPRVAGGW